MGQNTKFGKQVIIKLEYFQNFYLKALKCFDIILAYLGLLNLKEQLQEQ